MSVTSKVIGIISAISAIVGFIFIFINPEVEYTRILIKGLACVFLMIASLFPACWAAEEDTEAPRGKMNLLSFALLVATFVYTIILLKQYSATALGGWTMASVFVWGVGTYIGLLFLQNYDATPEWLDNIPDYIKIPVIYVFAPLIVIYVIMLDIYYWKNK